MKHIAMAIESENLLSKNFIRIKYIPQNILPIMKQTLDAVARISPGTNECNLPKFMFPKANCQPVPMHMKKK